MNGASGWFCNNVTREVISFGKPLRHDQFRRKQIARDSRWWLSGGHIAGNWRMHSMATGKILPYPVAHFSRRLAGPANTGAKRFRRLAQTHLTARQDRDAGLAIAFATQVATAAAEHAHRSAQRRKKMRSRLSARADLRCLNFSPERAVAAIIASLSRAEQGIRNFALREKLNEVRSPIGHRRDGLHALYPMRPRLMQTNQPLGASNFLILSCTAAARSSQDRSHPTVPLTCNPPPPCLPRRGSASPGSSSGGQFVTGSTDPLYSRRARGDQMWQLVVDAFERPFKGSEALRALCGSERPPAKAGGFWNTAQAGHCRPGRLQTTWKLSSGSSGF